MKRKYIILIIICMLISIFGIKASAEEMNGLICDNNKCYYYENGVKQTGFKVVDEKTYFFSRINDNAMKYGWQYIDGYYYYFDNNGVMQTGLTEVDGKKYYLNEKGQRQMAFKTVDGKTYFFSRINDNAMKYGWQYIDGYYYYFDNNGVMLTNDNSIDGFNVSLSSNGQLKTGFVKINGLYYCYLNGIKQIGFQKTNGKTYFFSRINDNAMKYGWQYIDGYFYYFDNDGVMQTGLIEVDGKKYYLNEKGQRQIAFKVVDGKTYFFSRINDNAMKYGWQYIDGYYYYFDNDGVMQTGLTEIDGKKYYLNEKGQRQVGFQNINGKTYFFSRINDNAMKYGWQLVDNYFYYALEDGTICKDSVYLDNITYNFTSDGKVKLVGWNTVNGQRYYFNAGYMVIGTNVKQVIDISAHQGTISWNEVYNSGQVYGVIVRIGYMGSGNILKLDTQFINNINALKKYGIPYGLYFYSYAWNNNDAFLEASVINDVIYKYNLNPTLGIYWDLEEANYVARKNNLSVNQLGNLYDSMTRVFMNKINPNYKSGIYANLNYANNIFNEYTRQNLKWIAQWSNRCDFMYKYNLWQYSNNGSVPGIVGRVDLDYYYD